MLGKRVHLMPGVSLKTHRTFYSIYNNCFYLFQMSTISRHASLKHRNIHQQMLSKHREKCQQILSKYRDICQQVPSRHRDNYQQLLSKCRNIHKQEVHKHRNIHLQVVCKDRNTNQLVVRTHRNIHQQVLSQDTIFSLSSGHGKCGVAVFRVSGPHAKKALMKMGQFSKVPTPRDAILRKIINPKTKEKIDNGLVLWFPAPHSFTGEDCVEFQVHGGPAVIVAMEIALSSITGLRQAEAGEFTKRAFFNEKLDLTEVEGLGDLIHAETEAQRKQALRQMDGDLSQMYTAWRESLMKITANIEASIEFSEDNVLEDELLQQVGKGVRKTMDEMKGHLNDNRQGERLRNGVQVAIIGEPNVGKSSILNSLCQRPAAIVSSIPGTTRDVVESALNIGGYPVLLSDTAGLRETGDIIEKEGVKRAIKRAQSSDIRILVADIQQFIQDVQSKRVNPYKQTISYLRSLGINDDENLTDIASKDNTNYMENHNSINNQDILCDNYNRNVNKSKLECGSSSELRLPHVDTKNLILVLNKCDLIDPADTEMLKDCGDINFCIMSCKSGEGMESFLNLLSEQLKKICGNPLSGSPSLTQNRHRILLEKCVSHLDRCLFYYEYEDEVMVAECLRRALREIGRLTGKIRSEDILDIVFRDFCIGK